MVRSLLSVDHRFWFDLLCIYMSVVKRSYYLYPYDVGLRLVSGHSFISCTTVATVNRTQSWSSYAAAPLIYLEAPRISAL